MSRLSRTFIRKFPSPPCKPQRELLVEQFLARPSHCLRLSNLVSFGQPLTAESVLASFNHAFEEIPRRLATRVRSLESLPFIVGMNPFISRVLEAHGSSFHRLATCTPATDLQANIQYTAELEKMVNAHANDIPQMAKGYVFSRFMGTVVYWMMSSLQESSRYMSPEQVSEFLDRAIRNRIAVRLIAEQHIALSHALDNPHWRKDHIGMIDMKCRPSDLIRRVSHISRYNSVAEWPSECAKLSSPSFVTQPWV
jgi:26S proteasome regulatory subunit T1